MKKSPIPALVRRGYEMLIAGAEYGKSPLLLAVRLYWGWQFCTTGWGKLHKLPEIADYFKELGIPMPQANALLASCTECFGGLFLLLGLASRLTAIPLIITMIVAYITADLDAVKGIFSDPDAFVSAAPFQFLFASLLVLVFGPGAFSIDHLLARKLRAEPDATLATA
jgi:putative oxidoreductase